MFSHIHIGVGNFERAFSFYAGLATVLGLDLKFWEPENHWAGWMAPDHPRPLLLIGKPYDGAPMHPGNGNMVAFLADSRVIVDQSHAYALAHGGGDEGAPGLRPHYHADYYGAYFRDPDGNKLCVCCHKPEMNSA